MTGAVPPTSRLGRRLLPTAWWSLAGAAWLVSLVVLAVLSYRLYGAHGGTGVDAGIDRRLSARFDGHPQVLHLLIVLGSRDGVVLESLLLAAVAASRRWWRGALLGLLGPPLAAGLTELVLKPAIGVPSTFGTSFGFPSGHTTGAFGLALTACVLLLPGPGVSVFPAVLRVLVGLAALGVAGGTGVALVAQGFHRATDVVGGVATATLVVLAAAALLDLPARRWS